MTYDPRNPHSTAHMSVVDRDMVMAEREASRAWIDPNRERRRSDEMQRQATRDSVLSSSTESSSASTRSMGRIATASGGSIIARTRTHPLEDHRTETHRLQQVGTVGASMTSKPTNTPLPNFGGGKPYPPALPPYEDYVVEYDGPDDPLHPQNWPFKRKFGIGAMLAYTCLCSTFTSSMFSASTRALGQVFGVSVEVATLSTSLYVLGYAFGPLIWGPFSELQGRKLPIVIGMLGFTIFAFATATGPNLQTVFICRFFTGFFGSCPLAVVAACFSDMFDNKQRGTAIVVFASMVFMGPLLAPFIGGFVQMSYLGWRWNLYFPGIMGAVATILNVFLLRETYPPIILVAKASELRRRTKNWGIHAKQEEVEVDIKELVTKNFTRPIRLLISEPVVLLITIYMSFIYGLLYLFLTAYPLVFQGVHGFNEGIGGLPFFGMVGGIIIVACYIIWEGKNYNKKLDANGGIPVPEWRLPPVIIGGVAFSIGLFWFGWTGYRKDIHWIAPTLSGLLTGFGLLSIFIQCFNYIIDTYLMFAASAIAANTFLRSISAAGFPLFARQMFNGMGIQWAGTLLGCFAMCLVPIPICFLIYGKKLRAKSAFAPNMSRKPNPDSDSSDGEEDGESRMVALAATRSRAYQPTSNVSRTTGATNGLSNTETRQRKVEPDVEKATETVTP